MFVLLQAAAFGGVFTGFGIARDFESGFARRLMLAAPNRLGILAGYALAALVRALIVGVLLFVVALLTGMQVGGDGVDLFGLIVLALLVNLDGGAVGGGRRDAAAHDPGRPGDADAGVPHPVPRAGLRAARAARRAGSTRSRKVNPFTALIEGGRDLISGQPFDAWLAYGIAFALAAGVLRLGGARAAEGGGGGRLAAATVTADACARKPAPRRAPRAAGSRACGRSSRGGTRSSWR